VIPKNCNSARIHVPRRHDAPTFGATPTRQTRGRMSTHAPIRRRDGQCELLWSTVLRALAPLMAYHHRDRGVPPLSAAGMALIETTDGVRMPDTHERAFVKLIQNLTNNMTLTAVSAIVAIDRGASRHSADRERVGPRR